MLPSSVLGLAVLLCLIPGLVYVRMVELTRHPREASPLLEGVEVLAMGMLSIALVVGSWTLVEPDGLVDFVRDPFESPRRFVFLTAVLIVGSTAAAYSMAKIHVARSHRRYTPTVWTKTFDEFRPGYVREAMVELVDGRAYQGTLLAYTLDPSVEQQLTLAADIKRVDGGASQALSQERMTFMGSQMSSVSLQYVPVGADPGNPQPRGSSRRLLATVRVGAQAARAEWMRRDSPAKSGPEDGATS